MLTEQDFIAMSQHPKPQQVLDPPTPRSRLQQFTATIKPDRKTLPRLLRNLKCFFLDSWFEILCILVVAAITGLVCITSKMTAPILERQASSQPSPLLTQEACIQVWVIHARPPRLFPLTYDPSISYPYRTPIFSSLLTGVLCAAIPLAVIVLAQLWIQSFADCSAAILGLLYGLVTGTCFQVIIKKSIGGLRPHFLAVCKPVIPTGMGGEGFNGLMYTVDDVCTGDNARIDNAMQSFPSGHSEIAFAGMGYLALYLFTHLRIADRTRTSTTGFWRMILVLLPLLFATYIASTLVLGYHHHAHDCFFGAAIGILTALLGYRTAFRSITDSRTNWLPRVGRRLKRALHADEDEDEDFDDLRNDRGVGGEGAGGRPATGRRTSGVGSGSETENEPEHSSPV